MSTEPFIGEIKIFGFQFAPQSYNSCRGQLLSIAEYTALFSLIGTTYGGDGSVTFGLPDFQGRIAVGQGQGPGLPNFDMGQKSGNVSTTLQTQNLPPHVHALNNVTVQQAVNNTLSDIGEPAGAYPGTNNTNQVYAENATSPAVYMANNNVQGTTDISGSGMPFDILNPYLVLNYCIAVEGIFPSRN